MRDRLIELMREGSKIFADKAREETFRCLKEKHHFDSRTDRTVNMWEAIADHLIANGVIVPPCMLKQTVWCLWAGKIEERRVSGITQKANGSFKIRVTVLRNGSVFEITPEELGKRVFLTREDAERTLHPENEVEMLTNLNDRM